MKSIELLLFAKSIQSNSNALVNRKNVRITKLSNYRDANYIGFCLEKDLDTAR